MERKTRTVLRRSNSPNVHVLRRAEQSRGVQNVLQHVTPQTRGDRQDFYSRARPHPSSMITMLSLSGPRPAGSLPLPLSRVEWELGRFARLPLWLSHRGGSGCLQPNSHSFVLWRSPNSHPVHGKQGRVAILFVVVVPCLIAGSYGGGPAAAAMAHAFSFCLPSCRARSTVPSDSEVVRALLER